MRVSHKPMTPPDRRSAALPETDPETGSPGSRVPAAGATRAAAGVVAWWHAASAALAPVLGVRGVAALYQRCLHLAVATHPFLAAAPRSGPELQLPQLQAVLARQTEAQIAAAGAALAHHLSMLLEGLIGPSLTQRLLHDVQPLAIGGPATQDEST